MWKNVGYYNGEIGPLEEMKVPMQDRTLYFGDGIYEAAMAANGKLFCLDGHLDRFSSSAVGFDIHIPMGKAELASLLHELLGQVDAGSSCVYWQVTRGVALR